VSARPAAIGKALAEKQGLRLGQKITLKGDIYPVNLELTIGPFLRERQTAATMSCTFHRKYVEESLTEARKGQVGTFAILAESAEAVPRIAREADEMFRNSDREDQTDSERAYQLSFVSMLGNVKVFLLSICGAVVFTICWFQRTRWRCPFASASRKLVS
jgi:putative ABC transport system permease protein